MHRFECFRALISVMAVPTHCRNRSECYWLILAIQCPLGQSEGSGGIGKHALTLHQLWITIRGHLPQVELDDSGGISRSREPDIAQIVNNSKAHRKYAVRALLAIHRAAIRISAAYSAIDSRNRARISTGQSNNWSWYCHRRMVWDSARTTSVTICAQKGFSMGTSAIASNVQGLRPVARCICN